MYKYNTNNNISSNNDAGFLGLLQIVFIVLKLTGVISWSWFWVLSPIIFPTILVIIILIIPLAISILEKNKSIKGDIKMNNTREINTIDTTATCIYKDTFKRNELKNRSCHLCATCPRNANYNKNIEYGDVMCLKDTEINTIVIVNEQHTIMTDQIQTIQLELGNGFHILKVAATGWNLDTQKRVHNAISDYGFDRDKTINIVFISPIPYLIKAMSFEQGYQSMPNDDKPSHMPYNVFVMANDNRIKKELPNGKIIMTVAQEGWYLV